MANFGATSTQASGVVHRGTIGIIPRLDNGGGGGGATYPSSGQCWPQGTNA